MITKHTNIKFSWISVDLETSSMLTDGRTDGQTDSTKRIFAFRNFANAPKS
jgi:hypothetical protein